MERVAQRSQHMTMTILQTVGKLLSLLSLMQWDVMIEFLEQLRGGRVDRSRWPDALQEAMVPSPDLFGRGIADLGVLV